MTPKEFAKYLTRDGARCWHCGLDDPEQLIPHHRANRGHGGSKRDRNGPANIITICSAYNSLMESSAGQAEVARINGWKLSTFSNPETEPLLNASDGQWYRLDNNFGRSVQIRPE